jgi:hypothetical protein
MTAAVSSPARWHARGDERVPWAGTLLLAGLTPQPRRLRVEMGHHRSLQHEPAVIAGTVAFLSEHLR